MTDEKQQYEGFTIEAVKDVRASWSEIEPLMQAMLDYHKPWEKRVVRDDWSPIMRDFMATRGLTLLARDPSGQPIGFVGGNVTNYNIYETVTGHVDNIFVLDDVRAGGVGAALLERFEQWCRDKGATELRVEQAKGNDLGQNFWEASGFDITMYERRKPLEDAR